MRGKCEKPCSHNTLFSAVVLGDVVRGITIQLFDGLLNGDMGIEYIS
jgi:hypothetical protein